VIYLDSLTTAAVRAAAVRAAVLAVRLALDVVMTAVILVEALPRDEVLPAAVSPALRVLAPNLETANLELTHMVALAGVVAAPVAAVTAVTAACTCSSEEHVVLYVQKKTAAERGLTS
tara:strand:+ start:652 stop:1005 length:354 start_codon:yes stop_codon:yes gene_type:complete